MCSPALTLRSAAAVAAGKQRPTVDGGGSADERAAETEPSALPPHHLLFPTPFNDLRAPNCRLMLVVITTGELSSGAASGCSAANLLTIYCKTLQMSQFKKPGNESGTSKCSWSVTAAAAPPALGCVSP